MIKRDKTIMIGCDYQDRLFPAVYNTDTLMDKTLRLMKGLKVLGVPVIFTQQYTKGLGHTSEAIREAAGNNDYLEKIRFSAWSVLKDVLPSPEEKPYVLIGGIESHVCVLQTAIELKENGYKVFYVADCASSRSKRDYKLALKRAEQEGIIITSCESILFELLEEAGTETSKAIQRIVK
ncbi:MAG: isochorismatase family protein [Lachnospiraceae bacterium]|nr:isochorismatase family protein [Candidatus Equihabitans merdae]